MKSENARRNSYYLRKYGITLRIYNRMLKEQNNSCALCKRPASSFNKRLAVEHNHKTGKVRALACFYCNKYRIGRNDYASSKALFEYMTKYDLTKE